MKGRTNAPASGMVIGIVALVVALSGTAYAVTATQVNIVDPNNPAHMAKVDGAGRLAVADGFGALTVNGTVNARPASPTDAFHSSWFAITSASLHPCTHVATPPIGKALVVTEVHINVFGNSSPGRNDSITLYLDSNCHFPVYEVNPSTIGVVEVPFNPGVGIPEGASLWAEVVGDPETDVFVDGYTVAPGAVPAAATAH